MATKTDQLQPLPTPTLLDASKLISPEVQLVSDVASQTENLKKGLESKKYPTPQELSKLDADINRIPSAGNQITHEGSNYTTADLSTNPQIQARWEYNWLIQEVNKTLHADFDGKPLSEISSTDMKKLSLTVEGTIMLLKKIADRSGKSGEKSEITADDLKDKRLLGLRSDVNQTLVGTLKEMNVAINRVKTSSDAANQNLANDLLAALENVAPKVESVLQESGEQNMKLVIERLQSTYAPKFASVEGGFGRAMKQVQLLLQYPGADVPKDSKDPESTSLLNTARESIRKEPKGNLATLLGEVQQAVWSSKDRPQYKTFLNTTFSEDIKLESAKSKEKTSENPNLTFDEFLKQLSDLDGDHKVEAVSDAKKEWRGWKDAITLGIGYAFRDKTGAQNRVHSELGLYDQVKGMNIEDFNKVLATLGLGENFLQADKLDPDTVTRLQNALSFRANVLGSREVTQDAVDVLAQSKEVSGTESMQRAIKKAVNGLNGVDGKELTWDQKDKVIAELTKRSLEFRPSVMGAKDLNLDALAQKFGEAIKSGGADGVSVVALDLRVLKTFYESNRLDIKGSAGLTAAGSSEGFLPIASIGGDAQVTILDSSDGGKAAYDKLKGNTTINFGGGMTNVLGTSLVVPYVEAGFDWNDAIGTVDKLGYHVRQLIIKATDAKDGIVTLNVANIKDFDKLSPSLRDAFNMADRAIKEGQAKLKNNDQKNAFAMTVISRFEKAIQTAAVQSNPNLRGLKLSGVKVGFAAGLLFAGVELQHLSTNVTEHQTKVEKTLEGAQLQQKLEAAGITIEWSNIKLDGVKGARIVNEKWEDMSGPVVVPEGKIPEFTFDQVIGSGFSDRKITIAVVNKPAGQVSNEPIMTENPPVVIPEEIAQNSASLSKLLYMGRTGQYDKRVYEAIISFQKALQNGNSDVSYLAFSNVVRVVNAHKNIPSSLKKAINAVANGLSDSPADSMTALGAINAKTQGSKESHDIAATIIKGESGGEKIVQYFTKRHLDQKFGQKMWLSSELQTKFSAFLKAFAKDIHSGEISTLDGKGFAVFSQVWKNNKGGLEGPMPAAPWSGTIGGSLLLEADLMAEVRTTLFKQMSPEDRAKYKDQPISMTLAFEKDAECFNPIFFFGEPPEPPTSVTPPPASSASMRWKENIYATGAQVELDTQKLNIMVEAHDSNDKTPPPPEKKEEEGKTTTHTDAQEQKIDGDTVPKWPATNADHAKPQDAPNTSNRPDVIIIPKVDTPSKVDTPPKVDTTPKVQGLDD